MKRLILKPFFIACLSFVLLLMAATSSIYLAYHSYAVNQEKAAEGRLNSIVQIISANLESKKQLANVLAGFVSYNGSIDSAEFVNFARHVIDQEEGKILSLQWAPKGIIEFLYPLEGNQEAKGLKLFEYETTRDDVHRSLVTRKPHINGPIPLVQGGTGFVYRVPVFSMDSLDKNGLDAFLGFAAVVVRLNEFLYESGIHLSDTARIALKFTEGAKERKYYKNDVFFGNKELFYGNAILDTLNVAGGKWIIGMPSEKSIRNKKSFILLLSFAFVVCAAISLFIYNYMRNVLLIKQKNKLLIDKNAEIGKQIKEKKLLINEIHHRVKNNFQLVSSLARLQSYELKDPKSIEALQEFSSRVSSLALTHEQLLKKEDPGNTSSIRDYITSLTENLIDKTNVGKVVIELDVTDKELPMKEVILIGIAINELVTNSLKYAFPKHEKGLIRITLQEKEDYFELLYTDNGIGMDEHVLENKRESFGIDLIRTIAEQLDGRITYFSEGSHSGFRILFKV